MVRQVEPANREGYFKVQFNPLQPEARYEVLETDYVSYSIIYSCTMLFGGLFKGEYVYILTRQPYGVNDIRRKIIEERAYYTLKDKIPSYNINNLVPALQGPENDCIYAWIWNISA